MAANDKIEKSEDEWQSELPPASFEVLRRKGTERAFTGEYWDCHDDGTYLCAGCGNELFDAQSKYESGSGWPSFYQPLAKERVATHVDITKGMKRTEVVCARCGGHLGHVFDDGPPPTHARYCMNSAALKLRRVGQR
jgi:peptide-methionine (R)-S-oxide reductase